MHALISWATLSLSQTQPRPSSCAREALVKMESIKMAEEEVDRKQADSIWCSRKLSRRTNREPFLVVGRGYTCTLASKECNVRCITAWLFTCHFIISHIYSTAYGIVSKLQTCLPYLCFSSVLILVFYASDTFSANQGSASLLMFSPQNIIVDLACTRSQTCITQATHHSKGRLWGSAASRFILTSASSWPQ